MIRFVFVAFALVGCLFMASDCNAQSPINRFANQLNRSGRLYHDSSYRGFEVVFRSSGTATRAQAIAAWRRSPPHAAILPRIRNIVCVGNVCVGRDR